jgi:hypothetical protein
MNGQRGELERIALSATFIGGLASVLPAVAYTPPGDRVAHARGNSR